MLNFESRFLEGLAVTAKKKVKPAPKKPAPKKPSLTAKILVPKVKAKAQVKAKISTPKAPKVQGKAKGEIKISSSKAKTTLKTVDKSRAAPISKTTLAKAAPKIVAQLQRPAFQKAPAPIKAHIKATLAASPIIHKAIKAKALLPKPSADLAVREKAAASIAVNAVQKLAQKPSPVKPGTNYAAKAVKAITPIARACGCDPEPVISKVKAKMVSCGYPANSVDALLSQLHDMNTSLEKAAVQRLATYEHNKLSAKHNFEHEVLSRLAKLAGKLPVCHPVRTKANLAILGR